MRVAKWGVNIYEIWLELRMSSPVSNLKMTMNELCKFRCMIVWHWVMGSSMKLLIINAFSSIKMTLIFDNHVMPYYACHHNVFKSFKFEETCSSTNNCKACLKHHKSSLYILSCCLLFFNKFKKKKKKKKKNSSWTWNCFNKYGP